MSKTKKRPAKIKLTACDRWLGAGQSLEDEWAAARFDVELAKRPVDGAPAARTPQIKAAISAIVELSPEVAAQCPTAAADVLRVAERLRKPGPNALWFAEHWPDIAANVKAAAVQPAKPKAAEAKLSIASDVWTGKFASLSKFKAFLNRHPEIKTERRGRRLLVDAAAALRAHAGESKSPSDPEPDDIQKAAAKIRQMKGEYGNSY